MASMQDIADVVGVSKTTVSLVLSGKAGTRVSDQVRERILNAAESMGYRVNDVARSLRTGRTNLIGVLVTEISSEFFSKLSFCIQEEAKKHGYFVITANTNESDEELTSMLPVLIGKRVDGIIMVPTQHFQGDSLNFSRYKVPVVLVDRYVEGMGTDYVGTDNYASARIAVNELVSAGKKRIGMFTLALDVNPINERKRGFRDSLETKGMFYPELVKTVDFEGRDDVHGLLEDMLSRNPDAIFFTSRRVFSMVMEHLSMEDIRKNDLILLCFDEGKSYKGILGDRLWYIRQPIEDIACKSLDLLLDKIDGARGQAKYEFVSTLVK